MKEFHDIFKEKKHFDFRYCVADSLQIFFNYYKSSLEELIGERIVIQEVTNRKRVMEEATTFNIKFLKRLSFLKKLNNPINPTNIKMNYYRDNLLKLSNNNFVGTFS